MGLRFTEICIDAADIDALSRWWADVLGWAKETAEDGDLALRAPAGGWY